MFDTFNRLLFDGQLPDCLITLQREKACVAYFSAERFGDLHGRRAHEIAMNPAFFAIVPLVETCATLVHEMVHLWQFVYGKPGRGRYHNEAFAVRMESIGLMPSSTGRPGGRRTGDQMADYPLPGGRFLWACEQLLTDEFKLSWYDRFTPHEPREMADHSAVADTLPAGAAAAAMVIPAHAGVAIQPARDARRPQQLASASCRACLWVEQPHQVHLRLQAQALRCLGEDGSTDPLRGVQRVVRRPSRCWPAAAAVRSGQLAAGALACQAVASMAT